jgi:hypothetical protein
MSGSGETAVQRLRFRKKEFVFNYKANHPCEDCGEGDPVVLELHHRNPSNKNPTLRLRHRRDLLKFGWREILVELEKCDVVCSNCHKRREAKNHRVTLKLKEGIL